MLSDFERSQVYGIWGDGADIDYFDRLKSALLSFFEEIFQKQKVNIVLYENVSNTFSHYALFVAQKHGAIYCGLGGSRLPGRFSVTSDPINDKSIQANFQAIRDKTLNVEPDVRNWVEEYIGNIERIEPDYMKINRLDNIKVLSRYFRADRMHKVKSLMKHAFDSRTNAFQIGNPLRTHLNLFLRNIGRRMRSRRVRNFYKEPVRGEAFLLYPIHFHPEASTSILSGAYLDEYEVIRNIAFSLPEGMRLYVKDHMSAWAYPSLDFYRLLSRLPNVRLLAPEQPTKQLIKASSGVITLTSTVGYEALLLKKRVFLYGRVFYEFHTGVTKVESPAALRNTILEGINAPVDWDDRYNIDFVCAYYLGTLPGTLNLMLRGKEAIEAAERVYVELTRAVLVNNLCQP